MKPSKSEIDPALAKQRARNKASRIRTKEPGKQTPRDLEFLASYEATYKDSDTSAVDEAPAAPELADVAQVGAAPAPAATPAPTAVPPRSPFLPPAMPSPPRIDMATAAGSAKGAKWQAKYGEAVNGRERACFLLGGAVHEFCVAMQTMIADSGGSPIVDAKAMLPIFVLAADDLLPPHVEATAPVVAGVTALTLSFQALVRRKQIQALAGARKGGGKLVAMDGGRSKAPAPEEPGERAAPVAESGAEPDAAAAAPEPVSAPEQPADGRPPETVPDYVPQPLPFHRRAVPPGFEKIT